MVEDALNMTLFSCDFTLVCGYPQTIYPVSIEYSITHIELKRKCALFSRMALQGKIKDGFAGKESQ